LQDGPQGKPQQNKGADEVAVGHGCWSLFFTEGAAMDLRRPVMKLTAGRAKKQKKWVV
jgi:hypothetical protein